MEKKPETLIDPRAYILPIFVLAGLMLTAGVLTHFIPPGTIPDDPDQPRVWTPLETGPLPWWRILCAPILCLAGARGIQIAGLIICIILIGASFALMNGSGAVPGLIARLALRFQHRRTLFLLTSGVTFAIMGSALGMMEEVTPMILFFVPLALRMGWDRLTGMAIPFAGAGCGFAAATLNPFTLGVAQQQAGIDPLFSGLGLRSVLFLCTTLLFLAFLQRHVRRLERMPVAGLKANPDAPPGDPSLDGSPELPRPQQVLLTMAGCVVFIVVFVLSLRVLPEPLGWIQDLAFPVIALAFILTSLRVGRLQDCSWPECWRHFRHGMIAFAPALVLILMAASVPFLLEDGNIKDTIIDRLAGGIQGSALNTEGIAILMFFFQTLLNLFIPGGTSQALLTVPVLTALDTGVSPQTVVLAFHLGDGFSNLIWPTNPLLLVALGLAGIRYKEWFRFILPLQLGLLLLACLFLFFAVRFGYGVS